MCVYLCVRYPGCCVVNGMPVVYPARDVDRIVSAFMTDLQARMPMVCGQRLHFSSKPLTPLSSLSLASISSTSKIPNACQVSTKPFSLQKLSQDYQGMSRLCTNFGSGNLVASHDEQHQVVPTDSRSIPKGSNSCVASDESRVVPHSSNSSRSTLNIPVVSTYSGNCSIAHGKRSASEKCASNTGTRNTGTGCAVPKVKQAFPRSASANDFQSLAKKKCMRPTPSVSSEQTRKTASAAKGMTLVPALGTDIDEDTSDFEQMPSFFTQRKVREIEASCCH